MPFANPFMVTATWPILTAVAVGTAMTVTAVTAAAPMTATALSTALSMSGFSPFPIPA